MCTKERVEFEMDGTGQETSMEDVADRVLPEQQGTLPASSASGGAGNSLHPPPPPHGPDPDSEIRDDELEEPSEVSHISNKL